MPGEANMENILSIKVEPPNMRWTESDITHHGFFNGQLLSSNLTTAVLPLFLPRANTVGEQGSVLLEDLNDEQVLGAFYLPSLRLATNFLTCNFFRSWWITIISGVLDTRMTTAGARCRVRKIHPHRFTREFLPFKLKEAVEYITISFGNLDGESGVWSRTRVANGVISIELHQRFLLFGKQAMNQEAQEANYDLPFPDVQRSPHEGYITAQSRRRMRWLLAICLGREMCNALWSHRRLSLPNTKKVLTREGVRHEMDRRIFPDDCLADAWECYTLGWLTKEAPLFLRDESIRNTFTEAFHPHVSTMVASFRGMNWPAPGVPEFICPVPCEQIAGWFQENGWERLRRGETYMAGAFASVAPLRLALDMNGTILGIPTLPNRGN